MQIVFDKDLRYKKFYTVIDCDIMFDGVSVATLCTRTNHKQPEIDQPYQISFIHKGSKEIQVHWDNTLGKPLTLRTMLNSHLLLGTITHVYAYFFEKDSKLFIPVGFIH